MITIKPFKAVRPTRDKAYLVATRSYVSYTKEELEYKLDTNPYTFFHVISPDREQSMSGKDKFELFHLNNETISNSPIDIDWLSNIKKISLVFLKIIPLSGGFLVDNISWKPWESRSPSTPQGSAPINRSR